MGIEKPVQALYKSFRPNMIRVKYCSLQVEEKRFLQTQTQVAVFLALYGFEVREKSLKIQPRMTQIEGPVHFSSLI